MERTFESQSSGYGRMVLGVIRATKAKVSGFFTAFGLPKIVVSMLTWALLISIGLMLAGLVAFAAFVYFAITSKSEAVADVGGKYCPMEDPTSMEYEQWAHENEQCWEANHGS